jgi:hypothetical protein
VILRNAIIRSSERVLVRIRPEDLLPLNPGERRTQHGGDVQFSTLPQAGRLSLAIRLAEPLHLRRDTIDEQLRLLLKGNAVLLLIAILVLPLRVPLSEAARHLWRQLLKLDASLAAAARYLSVPGFIVFDLGALRFYILCFVFFVAAVAADLNGSSIGIYSSEYGNGSKVSTWIGSPRAIRSDEWGYQTPAILNQSLRVDRFAFRDSSIGNHSVALTANLPVAHFSTVFRPQFWAFFVLPLDYAFSFSWQCKALLLVTGVFTWLLLMTQSTLWSIAGSLWFFFSPFTQWTYSWPSALPEMIGLICLAMVFACYLTVGRNGIALLLSALALAVCAIDFTLCSYLPHMLPLWWLIVSVFLAWCVSARQQIFIRKRAGLRVIAGVLAIGVIAMAGWFLYADLHQAISGVLNTSYPGKRIVPAGTMPRWQLTSNFFLWAETETNFPPALGNISEGSGFLWLAPVTLLCLRRMTLSRFQKLALAFLWGYCLLMLAWLFLPVPGALVGLFGMDRVPPTRSLHALGLANVAIVSISMAAMRRRSAGERRPFSRIAYFDVASCVFLVFLFVLEATNRNLGSYFSPPAIVASSAAAMILVMLILTGRKLALALALVLPQAIAFGSVNPIERGLQVFTSSGLYKFVQSRPRLLRGKWIVFADSFIRSSFFRAVGCDVYTGMRFLPDLDHFSLFAARGLNPEILNRLGYLVARPVGQEETPAFKLRVEGVVEWEVAPSDALLRQLGIKYAAFDQEPTPAVSSNLIALSDGPIDGFWLYQLP